MNFGVGDEPMFRWLSGNQDQVLIPSSASMFTIANNVFRSFDDRRKKADKSKAKTRATASPACNHDVPQMCPPKSAHKLRSNVPRTDFS